MINKRQYTFLSFFLTRSLFFGGALSLLVGIAKNTILITSIVGMIIGYLLLYLFYKKGSISKIAICSICTLSMFFIILSNTSLTSNFLLYETPNIIVMIIFFIPLLYSINKEIVVIPRISEIFFPISIIVSIFSFIVLPYLVQIDNIFPMFNTSILEFIKGVIIFTSASLFPNLILLNYKGDLRFRDIGKGYLIGCILLIIGMFFIISIYGYEFASIVRFPEYLILKKIDVFNYLSNVENIFVLEWLCSLIISSLLCFKVLYLNSKRIVFYSLIGLLFIGLSFIFMNNYVITSYIKSYYYYFIFIVIILSYLIKKDKSLD